MAWGSTQRNSADSDSRFRILKNRLTSLIAGLAALTAVNIADINSAHAGSPWATHITNAATQSEHKKLTLEEFRSEFKIRFNEMILLSKKLEEYLQDVLMYIDKMEKLDDSTMSYEERTQITKQIIDLNAGMRYISSSILEKGSSLNEFIAKYGRPLVEDGSMSMDEVSNKLGWVLEITAAALKAVGDEK